MIEKNQKKYNYKPLTKKEYNKIFRAHMKKYKKKKK